MFNKKNNTMKKKHFSLNLKTALKLCLAFAGLLLTTLINGQDLNNGLKLHYTFDPATVDGTTVQDVTGNGYNGTLYSATCAESNGKNSLILGTGGSDYLDMGTNTGTLIASLTDFSMTCYVWVNSTYTSLGSNGNMIATFANSLDSYANSDGYMFLQAKRSRYSITTARYETEQAVQVGTDMEKGKWVQFTYTQAGTTGKLYVNGVLKNTNTNVTLTPSSLGATPYNMLAKPSYTGDKYLQDAQIADFRIYNRAITSDEVLMLNGYSATLIAAYKSLTVDGDLTSVITDITLPTTSETLPVSWTSTLPDVVSNTGVVNRPTQYDTPVKLTATITEEVNNVTYTLTKVFNVTVKAFNTVGEELAEWDFSSNSISVENGKVIATDAISGFKASLENDASIRTIGTSEIFNVLDLGNGKGYLDMGEDIGKAIYSLTDYTMCGYFRIDESYTEINSNGNFIWNFSNSDNAPTDKNGYIIGSLKNQSNSVTSGYWATGNQAVGVNANAPVGGWHHIAYVQNGTTGTIYIDGVNMATGSMTNLPSSTLLQEGRTGTLFNWLGRSCYPSDVYLRKTLIYDFRLLRIPLTGDDLNYGFEVPATIDKLNLAYMENPKVELTELSAEREHLTLGDLSAVTSNITLPTKGTLDETISISWRSSNKSIIDSLGVVNRPDYFNYTDSLYATLSKNGQKVFKTFGATVIAKEGTTFVNDKLVQFNFATVNDSIVTDVAEKQFQGKLKNGASVVTIGNTDSGTYNVLNLGDSIGYFDLGSEIGKIMYSLNDFTIGAYYRINADYTDLNKNGNFLWNFSNSNDIINNPQGYLIASLRNQASTISSGNWNNEQGVSFAIEAMTDGWHHMAYTQSGTDGTLYVDGFVVATGTVTSTPANTLPKAGKTGTEFNWIGRSCYTGDVYLRKTLVYDFRLYKKALTETEVYTDVMKVGETISKLDLAYALASDVKSVKDSPFNIAVNNNGIKIMGISQTDKVSVFDITGRQLKVTNPSLIKTKAGVYIVKINEYSSKVIVK